MSIHRYQKQNISWHELLDAAQEHEKQAVIAMIYSAPRALWIRYENGSIDSKEALPKDHEVFELRVVGKQGDWRWVKNTEEIGRASCVTEVSVDLPDWQTIKPPIPTSIEVSKSTIDNAHLLWGRALETDGVWTKMGDPRIGPYWLPINIELKKSAALQSIEYLSVMDEHGNVGVFEERLTGITQSKVAA